MKLKLLKGGVYTATTTKANITPSETFEHAEFYNASTTTAVKFAVDGDPNTSDKVYVVPPRSHYIPPGTASISGSTLSYAAVEGQAAIYVHLFGIDN